MTSKRNAMGLLHFWGLDRAAMALSKQSDPLDAQKKEGRTKYE